MVFSRTWVSSAPEPTNRRLATKVFFFRRLGGVPVIGNKIAVSYALDGSLRKVLGRWHPLHLEKGSIRSDLSLPRFIEKAADEILELQRTTNLRIVPNTAITLSTAYVVREYEPGLYTLDLKGIISYSVRTPNDLSRVSQHVMSL